MQFRVFIISFPKMITAKTQLAKTQLAKTQLAKTQLAKTQLAKTQLAKTQLAEIDLRPIFFKMQCEGETLNGEAIDFDVAERTYRQFLTLHANHPGRTIVPSELLDLVWHYHILDTRKYVADCERIFGGYLHHDPYFGIGSDESYEANQRAWRETQVLWEAEFGEPLLGAANPCSSTDCR